MIYEQIKTDLYKAKESLYSSLEDINTKFYDKFKDYFATKLETGYKTLLHEYRSSLDEAGNMIFRNYEKPLVENNGNSLEELYPGIREEVSEDIKKYETLIEPEIKKIEPKKQIEPSLPLEPDEFYPVSHPYEEEEVEETREKIPLTEEEKKKSWKYAQCLLIFLFFFFIAIGIIYWFKPLWIVRLINWVWS